LRFELSLRSGCFDVEHMLSPGRRGLKLHYEGANARLLALASRHARRGLIVGARAWSPQRWFDEVGIDRQLLVPLEERGLIRWEGEDLRVLEYVQGHEDRIRGYCEVQIPAMMAARGYDPAAYGLNSRAGGVGVPPPGGGGGTGGGLSTHRSYPHPPLTSRLTSQLTPDPGSASRRARASDPPAPAPSGSGSSRRRRPPIGPGRCPEDRQRVSAADVYRPSEAEAGPEGFERWRAAMPLVRLPRSEQAARRWRDEELELWARRGLEVVTDDILEELERRKASELWLEQPRYIPSPINFLRRASWRKHLEVTAPKVWPPPGEGPAADPPPPPPAPPVEVYEPVPWPADEPRARESFKDYLNTLAERKVLS